MPSPSARWRAGSPPPSASHTCRRCPTASSRPCRCAPASAVIDSPADPRYMGHSAHHRFQFIAMDAQHVSGAVSHGAIGAMGFERPSYSLRRPQLRLGRSWYNSRPKGRLLPRSLPRARGTGPIDSHRKQKGHRLEHISNIKLNKYCPCACLKDREIQGPYRVMGSNGNDTDLV